MFLSQTTEVPERRLASHSQLHKGKSKVAPVLNQVPHHEDVSYA